MRPHITSGPPLITAAGIKEDLDKMIVGENCTPKQYNVMLEMYHAWVAEETERGDRLDKILDQLFK